MARKSSRTHPNTTAPSSRSARVLVVDDFEPWRRSVCSIIERSPEFRVVGDAADGMEAIRKAQALNPDLILLDIGLPKMNGIEAANRLRELVPGARILFLTGINDQDIAQAALRAGAQGYVLKTDAATELLAAMAGVLGGDDFVSSGITSEKCHDTDTHKTGSVRRPLR